jgi:hypothetical protein
MRPWILGFALVSTGALAAVLTGWTSISSYSHLGIQLVTRCNVVGCSVRIQRDGVEVARAENCMVPQPTLAWLADSIVMRVPCNAGREIKLSLAVPVAREL